MITKRFNVRLVRTIAKTVTVTAENEHEAAAAALNKRGDDEFEPVATPREATP